MSKAALASKETILIIVGKLIEISKLDTLFRDLYIYNMCLCIASVYKSSG